MSESGPCGELTLQRVPLPLNPHVLLEGLVPSECSCFKSAQLPMRLSFKINPLPVDWRAGAEFPPPPAPTPFAAHPAGPDGGPLSADGLPPVWQQQTSLVMHSGQPRCEACDEMPAPSLPHVYLAHVSIGAASTIALLP